MRLRRAALVGAGVGAAVGALFALGVVSFADCAGEHCAAERVSGVLWHAAAGAVGGAVLGALLHAILRLVRR